MRTLGQGDDVVDLAWKNGPGVNLLNLSYNAGRLAVDQLLDDMQFVATSTWGYGGFFTAPQFDMSFIRCLQQSGNASAAANVSLTMVNTPVRSLEEYAVVRNAQESDPDKALAQAISIAKEATAVGAGNYGTTDLGHFTLKKSARGSKMPARGGAFKINRNPVKKPVPFK